MQVFDIVCQVLIHSLFSPQYQSSLASMFYFLLFSCLTSLTSGSEPVCVVETSLDLATVHLVSDSHLQERSVAGCAVHCLSRPGVTTVMVSYSPGVLGILGDQFNCICGQEVTLNNSTTVDPALCDGGCPDGAGDLPCGDSAADLVSVAVICFFL